MSFKEDLIRTVERKIDEKKKDFEFKMSELEALEEEINEARTILQALKSGKPVPEPEATKRKLSRPVDKSNAEKWLTKQTELFSYQDFATHFDVSKTTAARIIDPWVLENKVELVRKGAPRVPALFRHIWERP